VRDLHKQTTTLVSINQAGTAAGTGDSSNAVISADGTTVAFLSYATDLVSGPKTTRARTRSASFPV
jgi:hypothetical protein